MSAPVQVQPLPYSAREARATLGPRWKKILLATYRWMVLARALDGRMLTLQRQGRIGFYGAATGQEAVNVAAGLLTTPEDWIFPGLREQFVALVRGFPLTEYAHSIFGDDVDAARGRQMPCHPTARGVNYVSMSSVIGTQISQAVGVAYALRHRKSPGVAVAFFGDGATSSNDFHAGLNFAGVFHLPLVFVCANNQWAISLPVERQTAAATLAGKAQAYGVPGERVDGTDFMATYQALDRALRAARAGNGPSLVEFRTFRMTAHSSSDDAGRYQPADWTVRAQQMDPVRRLEEWMRSQDLLSTEREAAVREECETEVQSAVRVAEGAPPPDPSSLTEDVYASPGSRARGPDS